ncbi:MAG: hypothetical protein GXC73_15840, partial [Chitinophagaceae bacterium]|nr:hypothetical protein [Chitinophagaceae bacterium]
MKWNAELHKTGDGIYDVRITGDLQKAWYIYSTEMKVEGLEATQLMFNDQQVRTNSSLQTTGESIDIFDSIFSVQTRVYRTKILLGQSIQLIDSLSNYITVTVKANAGNQAEFLPIEE